MAEIPVCPHCGDRWCMATMLPYCRHTNKPRVPFDYKKALAYDAAGSHLDPVAVASKAVDAPPADRMVEAAPVKKTSKFRKR